MALAESIVLRGEQSAWVSDPNSFQRHLERIVKLAEKDRDIAVENAQKKKQADLNQNYPSFSEETANEFIQKEVEREKARWEPYVTAERGETKLRGSVQEIAEVAATASLKNVFVYVGPEHNNIVVHFSRKWGVTWTLRSEDELLANAKAIALKNLLREHRPWWWFVYTLGGMLAFNFAHSIFGCLLGSK